MTEKILTNIICALDWCFSKIDDIWADWNENTSSKLFVLLFSAPVLVIGILLTYKIPNFFLNLAVYLAISKVLEFIACKLCSYIEENTNSSYFLLDELEMVVFFVLFAVITLTICYFHISFIPLGILLWGLAKFSFKVVMCDIAQVAINTFNSIVDFCYEANVHFNI